MEEKDNYNRIVTVPNILTTARIVGTGFLVASILENGLADKSYIIGLSASLALTDLLDGAIARLYHQESKLGSILDPIADKVFNWGIALSLIAKGIMPCWPLIIGARDLAVALITKKYLSETGTYLKPTLPAKLKMAFQSLGTISTICFGFGNEKLELIAPIAFGCALGTVPFEALCISKKIKESKELIRRKCINALVESTEIEEEKNNQHKLIKKL